MPRRFSPNKHSAITWHVASRKCDVVSIHTSKKEAERIAAELSYTPFYPDERLAVIDPPRKRGQIDAVIETAKAA